jgi:tRNA 2-thiouridine synthesizing protein A
MNKSQMVNKTLDLKEYFCPMIIVKASKAIREMKKGEILKVLCTDPGSKKDFESWSKKTGNKLLETSENNGEFTYIIQKVE